MKICAVYKITNTITGDFYIGSSKDIKSRLACHKCPSTWKNHPNNPMYIDMNRYGVDKFAFEILAEVEIEKLKEAEQEFIETLKPTYNQMNAKGLNVERQKKRRKEYEKSDKRKKSKKKYEKTDKRKKARKEYLKEYHKTDKFKKYQKEYYKSERGKESLKKAQNKYQNQLCFYNGEILTLGTLSKRFQRAGIEHPVLEAKKYLLNKSKDEYKEYLKEYQQSNKCKEHQKSDEYKNYQKEFYKEYNNQLCFYNGETLTLCALSKRFQRAGIPHPQIEAKKYLLKQ